MGTPFTLLDTFNGSGAMSGRNVASPNGLLFQYYVHPYGTNQGLPGAVANGKAVYTGLNGWYFTSIQSNGFSNSDYLEVSVDLTLTGVVDGYPTWEMGALCYDPSTDEGVDEGVYISFGVGMFNIWTGGYLEASGWGNAASDATIDGVNQTQTPQPNEVFYFEGYTAMPYSWYVPAGDRLRFVYSNNTVYCYLNDVLMVSKYYPVSTQFKSIYFKYDQEGYGGVIASFDNLYVSGTVNVSPVPAPYVPGTGLVKVGAGGAGSIVTAVTLPPFSTGANNTSNLLKPPEAGLPPAFTQAFIDSLRAAGVISGDFPYQGQQTVSNDGWLHEYRNGAWVPIAYLGPEWVI